MTGICALPPSRVAAPDDRNPPFAMFRRRIDRRPLRADLCRSRAILEASVLPNPAVRAVPTWLV